MSLFTIGNAQKDSELIKDIINYQKENHLASGADAVRELCKFALEVKKVK